MDALTYLWSTSPQTSHRSQPQTICIMSTALYMLCKPLFEAYFVVIDALISYGKPK